MSVNTIEHGYTDCRAVHCSLMCVSTLSAERRKLLHVDARSFVALITTMVCREVFSNWVQKFSEMVDENQSELDVEAVTVFHEQKQEYLEGVADDSPSVARSEQLAVTAVSQTAKSKREQIYGKKVKLVGRRT